MYTRKKGTLIIPFFLKIEGANVLSKEEAKKIADSIKDFEPQILQVEAIEQNVRTNRYQIRCKYHGPTIKYRQQLFLHGILLCIKRRYEWERLHWLLMK